MALFSYPVCTWLCQYVNMGVRKWLEKSAEKQKYKMRKTANPLSRKAFRAVSFSATKDSFAARRLLRKKTGGRIRAGRRQRSVWLSLHRAAGQARDEVALEEDEHDGDGHGADDAGGHHGAEHLHGNGKDL